MSIRISGSWKKIVLITSLCNATLFYATANGIPIDVLRNDPYFRNGSADQAAANSDATTDKSNTTNDTSSINDNSTTDGASVNTSVSSNSVSDANGTTEEAQVEIPKPISAAELAKQDPIIDSRVDISLGYMIFYTYPFQPNGIETYFDMVDCYGFGSLNQYGASFKIESMKLPSLIGVSGIGFEATWSPLRKSTEHYTLKTNLVTANVLFAKKVRFPNSRFLLEFHAGGGGMFFVNPTYTYETGYEPQSYNWVYPEAMAGIAFQNYFTRHWGLDINIDVVWPFLVEVPFPVAQVTVASGWHF